MFFDIHYGIVLLSVYERNKDHFPSVYIRFFRTVTACTCISLKMEETYRFELNYTELSIDEP